MIRGLRVAEVAVIQRLCAGDNRLFLRIGALLQSQFTCTEMALEATAASPAGKHLLSDRRLKDIGRDGFAALVSEHGCGELGLTLVDGDLGAEPGWRVIALDDELGNPLLVSDDASTEASATAARTITATVEAPTSEPFALGEMMSTLTPALRAPMEVLLQARADDQRAAALEQLRYAAPPLSMVSELMPMLLADAAEMVRERAIGLLLAAGANVAVVDLVRALHRRDEAAIARLAENIAHLPAIQLDLVVSALVAATARGQASQALVNLAQRLASHLAGFRNLDT